MDWATGGFSRTPPWSATWWPSYAPTTPPRPPPSSGEPDTVRVPGTVPASPLSREAPTYSGRVSIQQQVAEAAGRARTASRVLALATRAEKDAALTAIADALTTNETVILVANAEDVE